MEDGGAYPAWLKAAHAVRTFGAPSIFGRVLSVREVYKMIYALNIETAYNSRASYRDKDGANNWAEWAGKNLELNEILTQVEIHARQ